MVQLFSYSFDTNIANYFDRNEDTIDLTMSFVFDVNTLNT